jgi:hypothetical protein
VAQGVGPEFKPQYSKKKMIILSDMFLNYEGKIKITVL